MVSGFDSHGWRMRVAAARGSGRSGATLVGGKVLNVFTGELEEKSVSIADGRITAVGDSGGTAELIDCRGKFIAPSFVDPHIHTESSLLWMPEFARAVIPHGTGAVVTDPHEIANVAGLPGLEAMRAAAAGLPMHVRFTAPSCVPASLNESPGATFGAEQIEEMLAWPETVGLGELMNVAGAVFRRPRHRRQAAGRLGTSQRWPCARGARTPIADLSAVGRYVRSRVDRTRRGARETGERAVHHDSPGNHGTKSRRAAAAGERLDLAALRVLLG